MVRNNFSEGEKSILTGDVSTTEQSNIYNLMTSLLEQNKNKERKDGGNTYSITKLNNNEIKGIFASGETKEVSQVQRFDVTERLRTLKEHCLEREALNEQKIMQEIGSWNMETVEVTHLANRDLHYDAAARDFPVADVLDFPVLAQDFTSLMQNKTAAPEQFYRVLQSLQAEPAAIAKFEEYYQQKSGIALKEDLQRRFQGPEDRSRLNYALQLLQPQSLRRDQKLPFLQQQISIQQNTSRLYKSIELIHQALQDKNPEAFYQETTHLHRNTDLLLALSDTYQKKYPTEAPLYKRVQETFSGNALDYAQYLLGDQKLEKKSLTQYEAMQLAKAMAQLTFKPFHGERVPIPYDHPDGCYIRAHTMSQVFKELGYTAEKVYFFSYDFDAKGHRQARLNNQQKMEQGQEYRKVTTWLYHTAVTIPVELSRHQTQSGTLRLVFDPDFSDRPLPIKQEAAKISADQTVQQLSWNSYRTKLEMEQRQDPARQQLYPSEHIYAVTAHRNYYDFPTLGDIQQDRSKLTSVPDQEAGLDHRNNLSQYTRHAEIISLQRRLHEQISELKSKQDTQSLLEKLEKLEDADSTLMAQANDVFPGLFLNLKSKLDNDLATILSPDTKENFADLLVNYLM
ncbi:protein-glutamine glutaminase family protein [Dictyobacter arantiisoli]|uniref:Protein glutaminase domain-containing protein n=1 Tax=Dictyobacter arantiisoli TaxID=2014874 RepID=A0A5A5TEC0_9CHLR|nr:protein-glutamine glutaminase family protein [Dictyobacter arantiisoli]GCF09900.1 hypothetical protein KDI_34640 [Dictyobacter arantiisoli]